MINNDKVKDKKRVSELLGTVGTGCGDDTVSGCDGVGCDVSDEKIKMGTSWEQHTTAAAIITLCLGIERHY